MKKLPNEDYKELLRIVAQINSSAEATGYHSNDPQEFSDQNSEAWENLKQFCKDRFEGVA